MSKIVSQIEFIRRFAQNAGVMQKDAKKYLYFMFEDITSALVHGRAVRLSGIGNLKRTRFPSKTMPNPNDRSQQLLVLDRYYMRIKASSHFKLKIKSRLFPDKYSLPLPKYRLPRAPEGAQKISVSHSFTVPINIRPTIPQIRWRQPMSSLILDLRQKQSSPSIRLLRNLLRKATRDNVRGVTLTPDELFVYGEQNYFEKKNPLLYQKTIEVLRQLLPIAFTTPKSWRLLANLPSDDLASNRNVFNFSILPHFDDGWIVHISKPRSKHISQKITTSLLPANTQKIVDDISYKGKGHIAIIGSKQGRKATIDRIRQNFDTKNTNYHYVVEHHHHSLHPHHTLGPTLRTLKDDIGLHPITAIDELSGADNLYHLRYMPGVTISSINSPNKEHFDRLCGLQKVPPDFFTVIIEGYTLPSACQFCMPIHEPAVRFPLMRRLAGARDELLHVHPVRVHVPCEHEPEFHLINITHGHNKSDSSTLEEQLYRMALDHKINYNSVEEMLRK